MGHVIFLLYNLLSPLFALLYFVSFFISPRRSLLKTLPAELHERFGMTDPETARIAGKNALWIHAASVGEVKSLPAILDGIKKRWPQRPVLITTSTVAGKREALKAGKADLVRLAPLDFLPVVSRFIKKISPSALILVETELWPNTLRCAARGGLKIAVINGRISPKSPPVRALTRAFLQDALKGVSVVCAQTSADASGFKNLGTPPGIIHVTGNIKYDLLMPAAEKSRETAGFLAASGWSKDRIFTAGSTHPGEEEMVISAFLESRKKHPGMKLVIAPRHPERSAQTAALLRAEKLRCTPWSTGKNGTSGLSSSDCILLDEIGWLNSFYSQSFAAYVGGTFINKGGHNLLEPAVHSIPVLFGRHTQNTAEAADMLLAGGGGFRVEAFEELSAKLDLFLGDPSFREKSGQSAVRAADAMRGATDKTLSILGQKLT